jgi:serine protease Do
MNKSGLKGLALVLAFAAGGVALEAVRGTKSLFSGNAAASAIASPSANAPASLKLADSNEGPSKSTFAPVVKVVLPTVVNISSSKVVRTPNQLSGPMMDPFFQQFFGDGSDGRFNVPRERRERSLGSGVIVSPEGYILTNNHVVDGATDIRVTLSDKREFKATTVGTDPNTDVAVLKVDSANLPAATIGNSSNVQVGDYALAIGDPFGVGQTVTMGIVSAKGRTNLGIEDYEDFIQTDAPINPGNSGGALVNDRGELIGINTAILSHGSGGNEGIGFAVPINLAHQVMDQILKNGKVTRAYLGIIPQDVTPAIANAMGQSQPRGVLVGDVSPKSPAQESGLQRGDIIVEVNGKPVADANELRMTISMMQPDATVKLNVVRNGDRRDLSVKLGQLPTPEQHAQVEKNGSESALEGVTVENLDAQTAQELGVPPNTTGVVVTDVNPSSPYADSGLHSGDVIQEVNRQPVKNIADFEKAMSKGGKEPLLLVNRHGSTMYLAA